MKVKIHSSYRQVVAICDSDLLGKKFEERKKQLDLTGGFFKGEEKNKQEVIDIIEDSRREDATFNIVGKESCDIAVKCGVISGKGTISVAGIPIALVLL